MATETRPDYDADALVSMVANNVRAMTDTFLRNSWENAFTLAVSDSLNVDRATWRIIRDLYAREIDRRAARCKGPCSH